jgi:hypothetical protein
MDEQHKKSLAELLSDQDENVDSCTCQYCGYTQDEPFQRCKACNKWITNPTLGSWGKQLPIGVEKEGKLIRSFDLQPLDWNREREINKSWGTRRASLTLSDYIGTILAHTVTNVGNQDITKFKYEKKLLIFNQMYQADIFYMYAYLRFLSLGHEMKLNSISCISCAHQFPFVADLRSLEVSVIHSPEELISEIELFNGFDLNGQNRTKFKIKPPLWNMLGAGFPVNGNEAEMFSVMLMNCVVEIDGMPQGTILTEREISQFTKRDVDICQEAMEMVLAGPRWEIEGHCPKCNALFYDVVDWSYDRFFTLSSRSVRQRRRSRRL